MRSSWIILSSNQKPVVVLLVLLVFLLLAGCESSATEIAPTSTPPPRNIAVTGTGKVYLTPDIATISIGVHNEDESASRAVETNTQQAKAVTDTLLDIGVEIYEFRPDAAIRYQVMTGALQKEMNFTIEM